MMRFVLIALIVSIALSVLTLLVIYIWRKHQTTIDIPVNLDPIVDSGPIATIITLTPTPIPSIQLSIGSAATDVQMELSGEGLPLTELNLSKKINIISPASAEPTLSNITSNCQTLPICTCLNHSVPAMKQHRQKQIREEKSKEVFVIRTAQSREQNPSTARVSFLTDSGLPIETLPSHLLTKSVDSLDPDFVL